MCALYHSLNAIQTSCLLPTDNLGEVQTRVDCIRDFDNLIKIFSGNYPEYDIINYLGSNYTGMLSAFNSLNQFFSGGGGLTESSAILLYNDSLILFSQTIVNLVDELGNCHCQNSTPDPVEICTTSLQVVFISLLSTGNHITYIIWCISCR